VTPHFSYQLLAKKIAIHGTRVNSKRLFYEKWGKKKREAGEYDHPQSAAATVEGLAFLKRFPREPGFQGGEDV
jgi:hypothetical protein